MSISMCEKLGVPSVSTIASAWAASAARSGSASRSASSARVSSSAVPGSLNGIRRLRIACRRSASLVHAEHGEPVVREASASGSPIRPSPMTATS